MRRIRGLKALIHRAVDLTTELIAEGHEATARSVLRVLSVAPELRGPAEEIDAVRRAITAGVLESVRAVNHLVGAVVDAGLDVPAVGAALTRLEERGAPPVPMRSDAMGSAEWWADAVTAALNGALGDALHQAENGLDMGMGLRRGDALLDLGAAPPGPPLGARVAVFAHGLAASEWSWCLGAAEYHGAPDVHFGKLLHDELGYAPVFVRYNSGRHVSENGRLLADALERLVRAQPGELEEVLLVGHSMGGLVLRSACHYGKEADHAWVRKVRRIFCLGTPHQGAPLEKIANVANAVLSHIDLPGTKVPAEILRRRSAGIKDLRFGYVVDGDWTGRDPDAVEGVTPAVPWLDGVTYHFLSATVTTDAAHPLGQVVGDVLVRVPSASGPTITEGSFAIETHHHGGLLHHQLQSHPAVYEQIRRACGAADGARRPDAESAR